ncbi:MAG: hypothetical protein S4CHLAM102_08640 [Chlamydiia bacterium]|nr:hypothetical protein [Chlamydiia bacterium]
MQIATQSLTVNSTLAETWENLTNTSQWSKWKTGTIHQMEAPLAEGATFTIPATPMLFTQRRISEYAQNEHFTTIRPLLCQTWTQLTHQVEKVTDEQTKVTLTLTAHGPFAYPLSYCTATMSESALRQKLTAFGATFKKES